MPPISIILCDDHAIFREGIRVTLDSSEEVEIVAEADNAEDCLALVGTKRPDVVFLDINMPGMDGLECLKLIKKDYPDTKVIALTQYDEKRFVKQMMKFGANGYILKSTSRKEMLTAVHKVMGGEVYLAEEAADHMEGLAKPEEPSQLFPHLSNRELEIIRLLCHEHSTRAIAELVNLSTHTVESHRSNIFKKVGVSNIAGLVRWAVNNGLDS